ncbi:MAG: ABC transporter permease, partial [Bacteroidota bacterium]
MFTNRERLKVRLQRTLDELVSIGVESVPIIVVVSIFVGAVTCIQVYFNINNPFVENFAVGFAVRNMTILEMSPTVMAIIFAGRVGSSIAGQLGSMRITEQIDALEIMGINTNSYLVMPKIIAAVLSYPLLVVLSIFSSIFAGLLAAQFVL